MNFGAINGYERRQRYGHYFTFFWRSARKADLTLRFEYRQQRLGAYVQAKEFSYKDAKGSFKTEFQVIGDDYNDDGKVSGWRVVMMIAPVLALRPNKVPWGPLRTSTDCTFANS